MDLADDLAIIHQPARLSIMGLLYKHRDLGFAATRDGARLTDGNLATHAKRLEAAGLLEARRVLTRNGFELRYHITPQGSVAFRRYINSLRAFIESQP